MFESTMQRQSADTLGRNRLPQMDERSHTPSTEQGEKRLTKAVITTLMDVLGETLERLEKSESLPAQSAPLPAPGTSPENPYRLSTTPSNGSSRVPSNGLSWASAGTQNGKSQQNGSAKKETPSLVLNVPSAKTPPPSPAPTAAPVAPSVPMLSDEELESRVLDTLVKITRYPRDLLTLDAHLEDDLGIDSVKQAEISATLQSDLNLPEDKEFNPQEIRTISDIVAMTKELLKESSASAVAPVAEPELSKLQPGAKLETVVETRPNFQTKPRFEVPQRPDVTLEQLNIPSFDKSLPIPKPGLESGTVKQSVPPAPWTELRDLPERPQRLPFVPEGHKPFTGQVALVTGSGHGLGKVIAKSLAKLGAQVIINSFHSRDLGDETLQEIRDEGGEGLHIWGSMANPKQIESIFKQIDSEVGHLDFFVSNASNGIIAPLHMVTAEHWTKAFQTNIIGLHQGSMLARPLMERRGGGKIVTISSPGAQQYIEHFGCMGPVKAAMESLTRYLSIELGASNIQVNSISAGPLYGRLLNRYPDGDRLIPYWESITLGNQLGFEQDITNLIEFLLSPLADKMTGAVLLADRGGSQRI